jgi:hypothetical protein
MPYVEAPIQGKLGELWIQTGTATDFTTEVCDVVGASDVLYQITSASKRQWDNATTPLVYKATVLQNSGYTVQKPVGRILFGTTPGASAITVSGHYFATAEETMVQNWELQFTSDIFQTTGLGATFRTFIGAGIISWTGSFSRVYEDETWHDIAADNATNASLVMKLYENQPSDLVWCGYATPTGWSESVNTEGLVMETLQFTGNGEIAYIIDET